MLPQEILQARCYIYNQDQQLGHTTLEPSENNLRILCFFSSVFHCHRGFKSCPCPPTPFLQENAMMVSLVALTKTQNAAVKQGSLPPKPAPAAATTLQSNCCMHCPPKPCCVEWVEGDLLHTTKLSLRYKRRKRGVKQEGRRERETFRFLKSNTLSNWFRALGCSPLLSSSLLRRHEEICER